MFAVLHDWSQPLQRLKIARQRGKPEGIRRASWIADLAALGKAIALCGLCQGRWNAKANHYARREIAGQREIVGECDGCNAYNVRCAIYFPAQEKP